MGAWFRSHGEPLHIAECSGSKNNIQASSFPAQGSSKASLIPFDLLRLKSRGANFNRCGTLVTQNHGKGRYAQELVYAEWLRSASVVGFCGLGGSLLP